MDLDRIEGLNEIRPSVYRAAMKLQALQKLSHMDVVSVRHITAALQSQQEVMLNRQEVTRTLNRMFHSVSQEVSGHVTSEETSSLMFRLNDPSSCGLISAVSLQTSLIALSAETLPVKYAALVQVADEGSGSVSRSGLRSLLQDLSQVPAAVQEEGVFGGVEPALRSCFNGVLTPRASREHVLSWLQSGPRLLLWLPTLYRLSVAQNSRHAVRCHACKTRPITGLRFRCVKCVNVHLCQTCFLTDRQTRKHKRKHPVLEFCTQPTLRESVSSFMRSARHALLPRRLTQREVLMWAEPEDRAPPPSDVSHDASERPPSCSSKALQTDEEEPQLQPSVLLSDVRNLQRENRLMEEQLEMWRLTVQSEQGNLEYRCSEMEVTMETLREHNLQLQRSLSQVLNKMEARQHGNDTPHSLVTENVENVENMPPADTERTTEEEEEELKTDDEWSEEELPTPSPTMHLDSPPSHDIHSEEEAELICLPIGEEEGPEEAGLQEEDTCVAEEEEEEEEEEDCGTCSLEELLQETVERLKSEMTDRWTDNQPGERKRAELVQAADQVRGSIHHLVDAVRSDAL